MKDTRKFVFLSLMVSQSLVLYIIESFLPSLSFISPGAKIGLANIISLTVLYVSGFKDAIIVLIVRILISSLFYGGFSSFIYSVSGGLLGLYAMNITKKLTKYDISIIGVSVSGALFFNIGQYIAAAMIINNFRILSYLPMISYISVGTGVFVGLVSQFLVNKSNIKVY